MTSASQAAVATVDVVAVVDVRVIMMALTGTMETATIVTTVAGRLKSKLWEE